MGRLGFRDIELFNLALLARQGWRILKNPGSLSSRVLKAKYFPNSGLLESEAFASASQVWKAIHEGLQVLKQGLVKRIGDGEATNPWTEQWLPRDFMLRPFGEPSNASGRAAGPEHGHLERGGTPASFSAYGCGADTTDPTEYQAS
jgi:hypothetical protein